MKTKGNSGHWRRDSLVYAAAKKSQSGTRWRKRFNTGGCPLIMTHAPALTHLNTHTYTHKGILKQTLPLSYMAGRSPEKWVSCSSAGPGDAGVQVCGNISPSSAAAYCATSPMWLPERLTVLHPASFRGEVTPLYTELTQPHP